MLTVTTGRLLTKPRGSGDNGIGDLYGILNWMTSDNLFTHQLPRAMEECSPWLLRWFPELATVDERSLKRLDRLLKIHGYEKAANEWLATIKDCKEFYDIPKIPADDHVKKDPYDELVEMRGTDEGIVLL